MQWVRNSLCFNKYSELDLKPHFLVSTSSLAIESDQSIYPKVLIKILFLFARRWCRLLPAQ